MSLVFPFLDVLIFWRSYVFRLWHASPPLPPSASFRLPPMQGGLQAGSGMGLGSSVRSRRRVSSLGRVQSNIIGNVGMGGMGGGMGVGGPHIPSPGATPL